MNNAVGIALVSFLVLAAFWPAIGLFRHRLPLIVRRSLCWTLVHGYEVESGTPYCHCPECGYRRKRTPFMGHSMEDMIRLDSVMDENIPLNQRKAILNGLVDKHHAFHWGNKEKYIVKQDDPSAYASPAPAPSAPERGA